MRLGELLIQEKLISPQALDEALESQVVHGGRLGTNLLELGLLSEKDLARMLGQLHGCAHASGEMTPDPQALALVDLNDADNKDYLPMRADATRLSVAVINPRDYATLDAVAFKTGKRVVPVIVPEFRMNQLLRRYCKAFRPLRAIDMNAVRPSKTLQEASGELARPTKAPELISEEEFQSVYAQALTGGGRADQLHDLLDAQEEIITGEEMAPEEEIITGEEVAPEVVYAPPPEEEEEVITGEEVIPEEVYAPPSSAPVVPERPTIPLWTVPALAPEPEVFASAPPVLDLPAPSVQEEFTPQEPPAPVVDLPFIPAPPEAPVRRPSASFIPIPSDEAPRPAQGLSALPPVAPIVPPVAPAPRAQSPVASVPPAARPAPAAPGKAAPRRPAAAAATRQAPPKPFTFAEAQAQLAKSSDREDVATTVLRYAVGKWRRCLLLSVQGSLVTGWHGMGRGVREGAVRRIGVALREQSTFRLVRDTRSHYVGPVKKDSSMSVFYRLLGADRRPEPTYPKTAVILPLLVRGKVVHLLYLDNGPDQLTTPDVGELLILAQSVGRSYEAMIRRRKSA